MSPSESLAAKKRIMFIKGDDFNYLTYNILITLDALKCHSHERAFKDHHKLGFLIDLVSSPSLASMLTRKIRVHGSLSRRDLHSLSTAYSNGASRQHFVARIVSSLTARRLIAVEKGEHDLDLNVWLNLTTIPPTFLASGLYKAERDNLKRLTLISKVLRTLTCRTFLERYYADHGVLVWHS